MIDDCRAGKPAGWIHLARYFSGPVRWLTKRYGGGEETARAVLADLKQRFPVDTPMVEREFVAALRPRVVDACRWTGGREGTLGLDMFAAALGELTTAERQIVWLETMGYSSEEAAWLLRAAPETAAKARQRAGEMLRGQLDSWTNTLVAANGGILAEQARANPPAEPIAFRDFVDIIDGRMTWGDRAHMERQLMEHWYEVDHFCRVREADAAVRESKPIGDAEFATTLAIFGVDPPKPPLLKRLLGR